MRITPINSRTTAFQGYDARKLKAIAMTTNELGIAKEMKDICKKYGTEVWLAAPDELLTDSFQKSCERCPYTLPWAQDILNVTPDKKIMFPWMNDGLGWLLKTYKGFREIPTSSHIKGGNFYIVKNNNVDEVFVGQSVTRTNENLHKYFMENFGIRNVHIISQPDYHIDLGIRPLNNKNILVCDDILMIDKINMGKSLISKVISTNPRNKKELEEILHNLQVILDEFINSVKQNPYSPSYHVINQIAEAGFNPVRVPARFYSVTDKTIDRIGLMYDLNFVNALVFEKPNNELVYITNKSVLDDIVGITPKIEKQTGFSFEKIFKDIIKPYVKEKDIYFVSKKSDVMNNFLSNRDAGIHCLCAEIPL